MTATVPIDTDRPLGFVDGLARHGPAVSLVDSGASLTYAELDDRVAHVARLLGSTRRLVMLNAENTVEFVVAYLAALRGRHAVILVPSGDAVARAALINAYDPDVIIEGDEVVAKREGSRHELHPDLALLLSTSGSTGSPKLVRLSLNNLESNAAAIAEMLAIRATDRAVTTLPMHYCYGLSVLNSYLLSGASLVLSDLSVVDACFWRLAQESGVTSIAGVPHTFELLDRVGFTGAELPSLRYLTQAGGRMPADRVARYAQLGETHGFALVVMYGQTEATARMAYLPPALARAHPSSIGVAIPGGALYINEPDAEGVGELVYQGANVMLGYATAPGDLAMGSAGTTLRTGDLARQNGDGLFEIVGRHSRFIKPFGVRIDLDDLERVLAESGVCAVCAGDDDRLVVAVEYGQDTAAIEGLVASRLQLPASHVALVEFDATPRLATGKPDYAAITRLADRADGPVDSVRAAFRSVLGVDARDDDTFVGLGGDSLSYVEMSISLEDHLGELPRDWHTMPVAALERIGASHTPGRMAKIDATLAIRAAAIVLVVGTHTKLWQLPGGAHALIAVAGFNFARFQLTARSILRSVAWVAVPSSIWIATVAVFSAKYQWPHVLLVNDVFGRADSVWSFWFIEAIVQISLVLALVLAVPAVSRFERRWPFAAALVAVGVGLIARFDLVPQPAAHPFTWPQELFWLFALGWAAARAQSTRDRLLVTALTVVALPGFFTNNTRGLIVFAALAAITWRPFVVVPRVALRVVLPLAGASMYVYLTHLQIYSAMARSFGPLVATAASLVFGVAVWRVAQRAERFVRDRQRRFSRVERTRKPTGTTLTSSSTNAGSAAAS